MLSGDVKLVKSISDVPGDNQRQTNFPLTTRRGRCTPGASRVPKKQSMFIRCLCMFNVVVCECQCQLNHICVKDRRLSGKRRAYGCSSLLTL